MIIRHKESSILIWIFLRKPRKFHFFQQLVWFVWLCSNVQTVQCQNFQLLNFFIKPIFLNWKLQLTKVKILPLWLRLLKNFSNVIRSQEVHWFMHCKNRIWLLFNFTHFILSSNKNKQDKTSLQFFFYNINHKNSIGDIR